MRHQGPGEGDIFNSLTFGENPPYCYPWINDLLLVPKNGDSFEIHNIRTGKCLTSWGFVNIIHH